MKRLVSAGLIGLFALGCGSTQGDIITTSWTTQTARPSDEFVDSVGIDIRLARQQTAYYEGFDDIVVPALQKLHVRHVRDELGSAYRDELMGPLLAERLTVLRELGIELMFLTDPRLEVEPHEVEAIASWGNGVIEAFEAPTDHDSGRQGSSEDIERYTEQLSASVRQLQARQWINIVGPGCDSNSCSSVAELVDYGNALLEVGIDAPGQSMPAAIAEAQGVSSSRPLVSTGIGYRSGSRDQDRPGVSDVVMARYLTRALLLAFENDVFRSYVRHLIDFGDGGDVDANSGLLAADGHEKTGFIALANLLALLEDRGSTRFSGTLSFRLTGDLSDVHHVLLKTRDGAFFLILWLEVPSWDAESDREIVVSPRRLRLQLRDPVSMTLYMPVQSPNGTTTVAGTSFELDVADHPLVVAMKPD